MDPYARQGDSLDLSALDAMSACYETQWLRHIQLDKPLLACVDGRAGKAFVKTDNQ